MTELISLEEMKNFCRIDDSLNGVCETDLKSFREAAIDEGCHKTNRDWRKEFVYETFPASLKVWTLNRIASMFDVRGSVVDTKVNAAPRSHVDSLLDKWILYGGRANDDPIRS